ncbi:cytochrome P450 [Sodiomyces alkalinus F11]|uniref:Cytochrome P450 n=1 Tax=Sodiomyces alkalinus (strain CBS 110278 / VKM F-3762 / F11) TaxID=1314773 RepID=A0A3N2PX62_SODAK|nr:cytochrome P450 [Sodiomyces alkalinus F11]ROT39072.1 cytochrome P450 [Sodiomyces alkalinus F11]
MSDVLGNSPVSSRDNNVVVVFSKGVSALLMFIATCCFWNLYSYFTSPLRKYPGPFFARWTRLWYLYQSWTGDSHLELYRLHQKHGPIVRTGPNMIDVDLPELMCTIFHIRNGWPKTEFYHGSSALMDDGQIVYNLFSQTDPKKHKKEKGPIAKHYSTASIADLEPHMNTMIEMLCSQLETRCLGGAEAPNEFDLSDWILYYAWDVIGAVTFSEPIGYLAKGCDFDGTLRNAKKAMDYFVVVGAMPFLDYFFDKNPFLRMGPPGFNTITDICVQRLNYRLNDWSGGKDSGYHDPKTPDFLDHFIKAMELNPDRVTEQQIISWLMINMIAGADTTASTICSAFYHSLKNPSVWEKLTAEILAHNLHTPATYKDARALPYVDAVIREAIRVLPGVSMPLKRYVPRGGVNLRNGDYIPGGVVIGMNPYITNRNPTIYGEDPDKFRPERWLRDEKGDETEEAFQSRLKDMNKHNLSFGGGSRVCIGKDMALFQVYKVLVTLITRFKIELVDPKQWRVTNSWFIRQEGLKVRMMKRQP